MSVFPAYPRHLSEQERRAVLAQAARDAAAQTVKEIGVDRSAVDMAKLEGEAAMMCSLQWLSERVADLEAASLQGGGK